MSTFSERLHQIREENKYSQEQFAKILGVSRRTYQYYESGDKFPVSNTLIDISLKLNVSLDYLVGLSDTPERC